MKKLAFPVLSFLLLTIGFPEKAYALEGVYLGGEMGFTQPSGGGTSYKGSLGFQLDVGLRTNPILDIMLGLGFSSHDSDPAATNFTSFRQTLSAELHLFRVSDFDFTVGAGPGFYFYKSTASTETKFGFQAGGAVDVLVDDRLSVGAGFRLHSVFDSGSAGGFWQATMRIGYLFSID